MLFLHKKTFSLYYYIDATGEMWCCLWDVMLSVRCDAVCEMWCCLWDVTLSVKCDAVCEMWCYLWDVMLSAGCDAVYMTWYCQEDVMLSVRCRCLCDVMLSVRCDVTCEMWCLWEVIYSVTRSTRCDAVILKTINMMLSVMCGSRFLNNIMTTLNWL